MAIVFPINNIVKNLRASFFTVILLKLILTGSCKTSLQHTECFHTAVQHFKPLGPLFKPPVSGILLSLTQCFLFKDFRACTT